MSQDSHDDAAESERHDSDFEGDSDFPNIVEEEDTDGSGTPFDDPVASAFSCYSGMLPPAQAAAGQKANSTRLFKIPRGQLFPDRNDDRVMPQAQVAHDMLRAHILGEHYPCIGARSAFQRGTYRFGFYKTLAHRGSVVAMGRDLRRFVAEYEQLGDFTTFVAAFKYPQATTEAAFEKLLWQHLQLMHDLDKTSGWDPHYGSDPNDPTGKFAFSFSNCAFFVVGMHSGASRFARRFAFPVLVFNPESQIRRLIEEGAIDQFAATVRERDMRYQGSINPSLPTDHTTTGGEARVYSGMTHRPGSAWKCPFHARPDIGTKPEKK